MDNRKSVLRPSGTVIISSDIGELQADTCQCVHCQKTWVVQLGSGRVRGFCRDCAGPTCGAPGCFECDHFMKKIERAERS